mgnify:CR=1 FL=1
MINIAVGKNAVSLKISVQLNVFWSEMQEFPLPQSHDSRVFNNLFFNEKMWSWDANPRSRQGPRRG